MKLAFENVQLEVKETHDAKQWYLTVEEVARGYGVTTDLIHKHLQRRGDEIREGFEKAVWTNSPTSSNGVTQRREKTVIYREGVIKLGYFIRSGKAAAFRQWATNLIVEHLDKTNTTMIDLLTSLDKRMGTVENVCRGLRDEVDELRETLNIFFTDDETVQIRKMIKEVKNITGLDGRAVTGHIRKTLDISCVYGGNSGRKILNVLKNMIGEGIQLVKGEKNETSI